MIQGLEELMTEKTVVHLSEQPWSNYTKADYSIEQWHSACLIHLHDGPPTSKGQCKLPVKTPNGALNRNGVHAAAAALAGARGGVNASADQKAAASRALARYYSQLGEEAPDSLKHEDIVDFISHYGTKGMRWGIRKQRPSRVVKPPSSEAKRVAELRTRPAHSLTNKQLKTINERMNLEQNYNRMSPNQFRRGKAHVAEVIATGTMAITLYNMVTSNAGKWFVRQGKRLLGKKAKDITKEIEKGASFYSNM